MFNATVNINSVISWRSHILLVEEMRIAGENTKLPQFTDKLYHIKPSYISSTPRYGMESNSELWWKEEFEDTKVVIRIRKSKDRQHNGQKKKDKRTNNDLQNIHMKLEIE